MSFETSMQSVGSPASAAELDRLRELVGGELPGDYVEFLETVGGGAPYRSAIVIVSPEGVWSSVVQSLYDAAKTIKSSVTMVDEGLMPPTALLIGNTAGGSYLILSAEPGPTFGQVFFADQPWTELASTSSMADFDYFYWPIAESFEDFVTNGLLDEEGSQRRKTDLESLPLPAKPPKPTLARPDLPSPFGLQGTNPIQIYSFAPGINTGVYTERVVFTKAYLDTILDWENLTSSAEIQAEHVEWAGDGDPDEYDILNVGAFKVFRRAAMDEFGDLFSEFGEFLELTTVTESLWLFRCTETVDWDWSVHPDKFVFDEEYISEKRIFRNGPSGNAGIYFSRPIAERIVASRLRIPLLSQYWEPKQQNG